MRILFAVAMLALLAVPVVAKDTPSSGLYVGTVGQGDSDLHYYSTHGGNPCLEIWIPHTYIVTIESGPTDTMQLTVAGESVLTRNGVASVTFTANYCTTFTFTVAGIEVSETGAYRVDIVDVLQGPTLA